MVVAIALESILKLVEPHRHRPVRRLRPVPRLRRSLHPGRAQSRDRGAIFALLARPLRLQLDRHDAARDAGDLLPAAPVPGDGGRECRRAASRPGASGSSRSICSRSTCSCCRSPSPAGCCCRPTPIPTTSCCRCRSLGGQPLLALVAFLGGRVGGGEHGRGRDDGARHHGLQRRGDAGAAAGQERSGLAERAGPDAAAALGPARRP